MTLYHELSPARVSCTSLHADLADRVRVDSFEVVIAKASLFDLTLSWPPRSSSTSSKGELADQACLISQDFVLIGAHWLHGQSKP